MSRPTPKRDINSGSGGGSRDLLGERVGDLLP
jgi:hypothetical protein